MDGAEDPAFVPTDDCGVVLRYLPDVPVHIVRGSERTIKVFPVPGTPSISTCPPAKKAIRMFRIRSS